MTVCNCVYVIPGDSVQERETLMGFLRSRMRRWAEDNEGNIAITFALCTMCVVFLLGLSVDFGRAMLARTRLQTATDSAVLAAVRLASATDDERIEQAKSSSARATG